MSASPHANGGLLLKELDLGDFRDFAVKVERPGSSRAEATRVRGQYLAEVMKRSLPSRNFRIVGPDETDARLRPSCSKDTAWRPAKRFPGRTGAAELKKWVESLDL